MLTPPTNPNSNRWYDREHLEEDVSRSRAFRGPALHRARSEPEILSLYSTQTFEVLDSPAYREALANQDRMVEGQYRALPQQ